MNAYVQEQDKPQCWIPVVGYEGLYEVSNDGYIRHASPTKASKLVKQTWTTDGYLAVKLGCGRNRRTMRTHVVVATAFLGPKPEGEEVNHKDGDKVNNKAGNLEWVTRQRNIVHAFELGLIKPQPGTLNGRAKLTPREVAEIRRHKGLIGARTLAARFGVSRSAIQFIHQGKHWKELTVSEKPVLVGLVRDNPETPEGKYLIQRRDGSTVEWPSFVLGARDPHAAVALLAYADSIEKDPDCHPAFPDRLRRLAEEFTRYRAGHGEGDPCRGIHRTDDPETVAKMRRGHSA